MKKINWVIVIISMVCLTSIALIVAYGYSQLKDEKQVKRLDKMGEISATRFLVALEGETLVSIAFDEENLSRDAFKIVNDSPELIQVKDHSFANWKGKKVFTMKVATQAIGEGTFHIESSDGKLVSSDITIVISEKEEEAPIDDKNVYVTQTGKYYHNDEKCCSSRERGDANASYLSIAEGSGYTECPICWEESYDPTR